MGFGDNLLASGMAKGAAARGKRIAFGDGRSIIWDYNSEAIFKGNPNIARPGSEGASDLEWVHFYRGRRIYNRHDTQRDCWIWNYEFEARAGEVFFDKAELDFADQFRKGFVLIEPNIPQKRGAINKRWPTSRYQQIALRLIQQGFMVLQFETGGASVAPTVRVPSFRHALAALSRAALYIGPEGGLHHGAAALGVPAVVLFGAWIPPQVTGYKSHTNIAVGKACGSLKECPHCAAAMNEIDVSRIYDSALKVLRG